MYAASPVRLTSLAHLYVCQSPQKQREIRLLSVVVVSRYITSPCTTACVIAAARSRSLALPTTDLFYLVIFHRSIGDDPGGS